MIIAPPAADLQNEGDMRIRSRFERPALPRSIDLREESSANPFESFALDCTYLGLGKSWGSLRFFEKPTVTLQPDNTALVDRWKVSVPHTIDGITTLPKEMARQFLRLWQLAEHRQLDESEEQTWFDIIETVDLDEFYRSLERPKYFEGQLRGGGDSWRIVWLGEERSRKIPKDQNVEFSICEKGDWIGGEFMLDENGEIVKAQLIRPIVDPETLDFENWPEVAS